MEIKFEDIIAAFNLGIITREEIRRIMGLETATTTTEVSE